jgi:hypothetical protein
VRARLLSIPCRDDEKTPAQVKELERMMKKNRGALLLLHKRDDRMARYHGHCEPPNTVEDMTLEMAADWIEWFDGLSDPWKDALARDAIKVLKYGMTLLRKESTD